MLSESDLAGNATRPAVAGRLAGAIALALMVGAVAGCASRVVVDDWPLGAEIPCTFTERAPEARALIEQALRDRKLDGESAAVRCFSAADHKVDGQTVLLNTAPGGLEIYVFSFENGVLVAVPISCPGLSPGPIVAMGTGTSA